MDVFMTKEQPREDPIKAFLEAHSHFKETFRKLDPDAFKQRLEALAKLGKVAGARVTHGDPRTEEITLALNRLAVWHIQIQSGC